MRSKKCKICGERFETSDSFRQWCSPECGVTLAKQKTAKARVKAEKAREKAERERIKQVKDRLRNSDRSYWLKKAQDEVNRFIRLRDKGLPCIACGEPWRDNFQASHYVPRGRSAFLRFHEDNIHGGCVKCNLYESGNLRMFRIGLVSRIGNERTEWLEDNAHRLKKWTIDELKELLRIYKQKCKELMDA
ncbi:recombination protein NinG [Pasteurella langaaensis]|uniref:recombination protein NinG n=1 Tax=Alitibacter langaaensis TaxID=756 RepID=UPI001FAFAA3B|nr:recombination protein NinG [Pasteurella langaaensis]